MQAAAAYIFLCLEMTLATKKPWNLKTSSSRVTICIGVFERSLHGFKTRTSFSSFKLFLMLEVIYVLAFDKIKCYLMGEISRVSSNVRNVQEYTWHTVSGGYLYAENRHWHSACGHRYAESCWEGELMQISESKESDTLLVAVVSHQ